MLYYIDIAFTGISNFEFMKNYIKNIAKKYNYSHYYISHDIRQGRGNSDVKCVMTVQFSDNNVANITKFLKTIMMIHNVYIESIYNNI
jgi:hypothetical protein